MSTIANNSQGDLQFGLHLDGFGRLVLIDADGRRYAGVEPVRAFPLTDPDHWISICDGEGREIVLVEDPAVLPERVRTVLDEELRRRHFMPQLLRIVRITGTDPTEWEVHTDRGPTTLIVRSDEEIRRFGSHKLLVVDAHGTRYVIEDLRALDHTSRRLLDRYL
jgi:hypothetical protein